MQHIKVVCVGDGTVGKTCLLISYTLKAFPTEYIPTVFDNYNAVVDWDGRKVNIGLWDTAGQDDFERMRPLCYEQADVFLLMFSIASPDSYNNISTKWLNEVNRAKTSDEVPIILVGTKADVRSDEAFLRSIAPVDPISFKEGKKLAKDIGAISYLECSAIKGVGFEDIFAQCVAAITNSRIMHKDISKICYHTTCETKFTLLKKKKCVRCQHFFCPLHVNTLPSGHDYHGKNMCLHCLNIDVKEPLQKRQKTSVLKPAAEKKKKKEVPKLEVEVEELEVSRGSKSLDSASAKESSKEASSKETKSDIAREKTLVHKEPHAAAESSLRPISHQPSTSGDEDSVEAKSRPEHSPKKARKKRGGSFSH